MSQEGVSTNKKQPVEKITLEQTKDGMYDSTPKIKDVIFELNDSNPNAEVTWLIEARGLGHEEYVSNVQIVVDYCKKNNLKTEKEIEEVFKKFEWE